MLVEPGRLELQREPLLQQAAIAEIGEGIMVGEVLESGLGLLQPRFLAAADGLLIDIAHGDEEALRGTSGIQHGAATGLPVSRPRRMEGVDPLQDQ
ncbi:hypothetical protein D3C80_1068650 [compost metagenome]